MTKPVPDIVLISDRIASNQLAELVDRFFTDMVKYVVDVERGIAAVGGELHADAEQLLLEAGSRQSSRHSSTSGRRRGTRAWRSRTTMSAITSAA